MYEDASILPDKDEKDTIIRGEHHPISTADRPNIDMSESIEDEEDQVLDEKTYTVGDKQYWRRGGKCYCWTASNGKIECSEEEYMKAISGGNANNDAPKNTEPSEDKAKLFDPSSFEVGAKMDLGDWSYTKVGNNSWTTTYKGKEQPPRTDADIKRVFSGADSATITKVPSEDKARDAEPAITSKGIDHDMLKFATNDTLLDTMSRGKTLKDKKESIVKQIMAGLPDIRKGPKDPRVGQSFAYDGKYKDKPVDKEMAERCADYILDQYKEEYGVKYYIDNNGVVRDKNGVNVREAEYGNNALILKYKKEILKKKYPDKKIHAALLGGDLKREIEAEAIPMAKKDKDWVDLVPVSSTEGPKANKSKLVASSEDPKKWSNSKVLTYDQAKQYAKAVKTKGARDFLETWEDYQFDYYVKAFGPMTVKKFKSLIDTYDNAEEYFTSDDDRP